MLNEFMQIAFGILVVFLLFRLWFIALGALWDRIEKAFSRDFEDK